MLRPPGLQAPSLTGYGRHLCAGCSEETDGIPVGGYCPTCRRRREREAARLAQRVAIVATVPVLAYALWILSRLPEFRVWAVAGVLVWYVAVRRITKSIALYWIR